MRSGSRLACPGSALGAMGCGYFRGSGFGRHFRAQLKQRQPPIRAERFSLSWQVDTRNWFVCYNIAAVYEWALNSAVECHPHTVEVVGSNPTAPTTRLGCWIRGDLQRVWPPGRQSGKTGPSGRRRLSACAFRSANLSLQFSSFHSISLFAPGSQNCGGQWCCHRSRLGLGESPGATVKCRRPPDLHSTQP